MGGKAPGVRGCERFFLNEQKPQRGGESCSTSVAPGPGNLQSQTDKRFPVEVSLLQSEVQLAIKRTAVWLKRVHFRTRLSLFSSGFRSENRARMGSLHALESPPRALSMPGRGARDRKGQENLSSLFQTGKRRTPVLYCLYVKARMQPRLEYCLRLSTGQSKLI